MLSKLCGFNSSLLFLIWGNQGIEVMGMCTFIHQTKTEKNAHNFQSSALG